MRHAVRVASRGERSHSVTVREKPYFSTFLEYASLCAFALRDVTRTA
ncbi:hypothetical protein BIFBIF_01591 [Bifidobacterium bifidum ATCC 29521 = JCM 1255 = DSM 20456]|nr:hypothetical protein BIFBIF_01591 [Bifidobacterium bifidum ATCC 29521 = JCM 1255 = DSM 20456]